MRLAAHPIVSLRVLYYLTTPSMAQCDSTWRPFRMRRISTRRPDTDATRFHQPYTLMRLPSRARGNEFRMLVRVEISDHEPPATGPIGRALNVLRAERCSSETAGSLGGVEVVEGCWYFIGWMVEVSLMIT